MFSSLFFTDTLFFTDSLFFRDTLFFTDTAATGTSSVSMVTSPGQTESPQSPSFSLGPVPTSPVSVSSQGSFFDETVGFSYDNPSYSTS